MMILHNHSLTGSPLSKLSMEISITNQTQEYDQKLLKVSSDINTGREESSVTSQSTMAVIGDDLSLTNTSDSNEVTQEFSLRTKGIQEYKNENIDYPRQKFQLEGNPNPFQKIERSQVYLSGQRQIQQYIPSQGIIYNRPDNRNNDGHKGYRGRYYKPRDSRKNKNFQNFKSKQTRKFQNTPRLDSNTSQAVNESKVTLTRENLNKLDAESDYMKIESTEEEPSQELPQNTPNEATTNPAGNKNFNEFFWTTKRQARLLKTKYVNSKKADGKLEIKAEIHNDDGKSNASQGSSCDSNCGLVNQDSSLRDINLCDNKNDIWYGLTRSDGKAVYVSSNRGRTPTQHQPKYGRPFKRNNYSSNFRYHKTHFQTTTDTRRLPRWKTTQHPQNRSNTKNFNFKDSNSYKKHYRACTMQRQQEGNNINQDLTSNRRIFNHDNILDDEKKNSYSANYLINKEPTTFLENKTLFTKSEVEADSTLPPQNPILDDHENEISDSQDIGMNQHKSRINRKLINPEGQEWKLREINDFRFKKHSRHFNTRTRELRPQRTHDKKATKKNEFKKQSHSTQKLPKFKKNNNFQHQPNPINSSILEKTIPTYSSFRPLISYDDLELQENMHNLDKRNDTSNEPQKDKNLLNTSEGRKHVQKLLAESRGL